MSAKGDADCGRSLSTIKDAAPRERPREDTKGSDLLSPSRSRSLFRPRVSSSIGLPLPMALLCPLTWDTGVLLRGLKEGATGDILTGCRPYSMLSLQNIKHVVKHHFKNSETFEVGRLFVHFTVYF